MATFVNICKQQNRCPHENMAKVDDQQQSTWSLWNDVECIQFWHILGLKYVYNIIYIKMNVECPRIKLWTGLALCGISIHLLIILSLLKWYHNIAVVLFMVAWAETLKDDSSLVNVVCDSWLVIVKIGWQCKQYTVCLTVLVNMVDYSTVNWWRI